MLTAGFSFKDFKEFAFKCRRANIFIKILELQGKWKQKKTLLACFYKKIFAIAALASGSDSLPLVQLKYSLNNFCSQPETNDVTSRLATSIS